MLQSEYVKLAYKPESSGHSFIADGQTPPLVHTYRKSYESHPITKQSNVMGIDPVEITTISTRETGFVFRNNQQQAQLTGEVSVKTWPESAESIGTGSGGNTAISPISKKNNSVEINPDPLPPVKHASGGPIEDLSEPLNTFEPVRLTAPQIEVEAANWLANGDDIGEREDPVLFIWPAEKNWLSGYNFSINHPGIDIAAYYGDLIFAAASGQVASVQYSNRGYGNMVIINHLNGYQSLYAHLSTILTEMDSFVIQGQPIGLAGSTGNSTGSHLHFEIHDQGRYVNPWLFLTP